jgi:predicted nucleic acid-binding protein
MMIAAIAAVNHAAIATRNVKDFTDTGVDLINPWSMVN